MHMCKIAHVTGRTLYKKRALNVTLLFTQPFLAMWSSYLSLACVALLASFRSALAQQCACATTIVNVRSGAGTTHSVLGSLNPNQCLTYKGNQLHSGSYDWAHVDYHGHDGWVATNYVHLTTCGGTSTGTGTHGKHDCHGNIMALHPTGASAATAHQEGLTAAGPGTSHTIVDKDLGHLNPKKHCYVAAGDKNCLAPALIAAMASRETHGGSLITHTGGWGDSHHAYGILQCDVRTSGLGTAGCTKYHWDSCEHIEMMIDTIFLGKLREIEHKFPSWTQDQKLQGAVAAYNGGSARITSFAGVDAHTYLHDYSNDVIARAQRLVTAHGW